MTSNLASPRVNSRSLGPLSLLLFVGSSLGSGASELAKLTANEAARFDRFGQSVAMTSGYLIVGAHNEDPGGVSNAGSVYVYSRETGEYLRTLNASDKGQNDNFGWSLAAEGGQVLIGAPGNDSGACYLFDLNTGVEQAIILPSDPASGDQFGRAVAMSSQHLLVGAWLSEEDDNNPSENSGAAYLYSRSTQTELFRLEPNDLADADQFGGSVALAGSTVCVGSLFNDHSGQVDAGAVYLFNSTTGVQLGKLTAPSPSEGDVFGAAIAADGDRLVVGAPEADPLGESSGASFLYQVSSQALVSELVPLIGQAGERSGWAVAIGEQVLVGAYRSQVVSESDHGTAHLFSLDGGYRFTLHSSDGMNGDFLGHSVALEGSECLVGAVQHDAEGPSAGAAYYFAMDSSPALHSVDVVLSGSVPELSWQGTPGVVYQLFTTTDLTSWPEEPFATSVALQAAATYSHVGGGGETARFYRISVDE